MKPDRNESELYNGEEHNIGFVVASADPSELLEPAREAFHHVSLLILLLVVLPGVYDCSLAERWEHAWWRRLARGFRRLRTLYSSARAWQIHSDSLNLVVEVSGVFANTDRSFEAIRDCFLHHDSCELLLKNEKVLYTLTRQGETADIATSQLGCFFSAPPATLLEGMRIRGRRLEEIWDQVTVVDIFSYTYGEVSHCILLGGEVGFICRGRYFWIASCNDRRNREKCYLALDETEGTFYQEFPSPEALLRDARLDGMSIQELWDEIEIDQIQR